MFHFILLPVSFCTFVSSSCSRRFPSLISSFAADFSMERRCSVFSLSTVAVVLLVLAIHSSVGQVYGVRDAIHQLPSRQQNSAGSQEETRGIAMVQNGLRSLQKHSALVAEKSRAGAAPCLQEDVGSTAPEFAVKHISASSARDGFRKCQQECQAAGNCNHFTYNRDTRKCFLKTSQPRYRYYRGDMSATRDCDLNQNACFKMHTGSTSSDVKEAGQMARQNPPAKEILLCQTLCQRAYYCTHFTYNTATGKCFLKKGDPRYRGYGNDMSASKDCDLGTANELQALVQAKHR
ncbi:microneme protein mic4 [Cystoisospora suis]|uniref:Microneme protein mic4 n=1 Tax=Cystoisospora suis TaxID=483139 RepID=A0A2C6KQQ7_9APIC|nr:microneme protein mic4 [Cystoisospora suis]